MGPRIVLSGAAAVFAGGHAVAPLEQTVEVGVVGEAQLRGDGRRGHSGLSQQLRGLRHGEFHAVLEQAFAGVLFHDPPQVGAVVVQQLRQLPVGDPAPPLAENPVDAAHQQLLHAGFRGDPGHVVEGLISQHGNQPGQQLQQAIGCPGLGVDQGAQKRVQQTVNPALLLRLGDLRDNVQEIPVGGVVPPGFQEAEDPVGDGVLLPGEEKPPVPALQPVHQLLGQGEEDAGVIRGVLLRVEGVPVHQTAVSGGIVKALSVDELIQAALQDIGELIAVVEMHVRQAVGFLRRQRGQANPGARRVDGEGVPLRRVGPDRHLNN